MTFSPRQQLIHLSSELSAMKEVSMIKVVYYKKGH